MMAAIIACDSCINNDFIVITPFRLHEVACELTPRAVLRKYKPGIPPARTSTPMRQDDNLAGKRVPETGCVKT
jgi:hypothetical protein